MEEIAAEKEVGHTYKDGDILCVACMKNRELVRKFAGMSETRWNKIQSPHFKLKKREAANLAAYRKHQKSKAVTYTVLPCKYCKNTVRESTRYTPGEELGRDMTNEKSLCKVCRKDPELVRRFLGVSKKRWRDFDDPSSEWYRKGVARLEAIEKEYDDKLKSEKKRRRHRHA